MRMVWFSAPATFSHARTGNIYMSTHRTTRFTQHMEGVMRDMGVPIVDGRAITQSRWDASYDGLHYASVINGDNWGSQVASMEYQVVMNTVFPTCTGQ